MSEKEFKVRQARLTDRNRGTDRYRWLVCLPPFSTYRIVIGSASWRLRASLLPPTVVRRSNTDLDHRGHSSGRSTFINRFKAAKGDKQKVGKPNIPPYTLCLNNMRHQQGLISLLASISGSCFESGNLPVEAAYFCGAGDAERLRLYVARQRYALSPIPS